MPCICSLNCPFPSNCPVYRWVNRPTHSCTSCSEWDCYDCIHNWDTTVFAEYETEPGYDYYKVRMVRCKSCNNYGRYIIEDAHNGPSNFTKPDTSEPLEEFEDELIN